MVCSDLMTDDLLLLVYDELRRLAANKLAGKGPGQTLHPTALVVPPPTRSRRYGGQLRRATTTAPTCSRTPT